MLIVVRSIRAGLPRDRGNPAELIDL